MVQVCRREQFPQGRSGNTFIMTRKARENRRERMQANKGALSERNETQTPQSRPKDALFITHLFKRQANESKIHSSCLYGPVGAERLQRDDLSH